MFSFYNLPLQLRVSLAIPNEGSDVDNLGLSFDEVLHVKSNGDTGLPCGLLVILFTVTDVGSPKGS